MDLLIRYIPSRGVTNHTNRKSNTYKEDKMKYLKYTFIYLLSLFFVACSDAFTPESARNEDNAKIIGDKIVLTGAVDVSGFREATTRAFSDVPNLEDLNLYIVEFVDNGSPLINTLNAVYRPDENSEKVEGDVVKYKLTLNRTDQPRILHFLALADDKLQIPNGVESSVMPGLTSTNSNDAYWRRLEFKEGYCTHNTADDTWDFNQDFKDQLLGDETNGPKNIKLVRNFAKITVGIAEDATFAEGSTGFTLEGFIVVNTPQKGTMVPYSSTNREFPEFLDGNGAPLPYQTVAQKYSGISPANTLLSNQVTSDDAPEIVTQEDLDSYTQDSKIWNCLPSQYIYERPFNSLNHTYIIIKGKYHNTLTNPDDESSYYKLDIGANDASSGIFRYYGLLRNYNYFIRINRIETSGYKSVSEAAEGSVYNNISFDISTDHLINMSNGRDIVRVNFTTAVITEPNVTLDFRYAYKEGILQANNGTYNNGLVTIIGLGADNVPGSVIKEVKYLGDQSLENDNTPWRTLQIECDDPTAVTKTQEFTIVNKNTGLGRTITLVSHLKWDFENLYQYAGIWEDYPDTYNGLHTQNSSGGQGSLITGLNNSTYADRCGTNVGSQFTIFFDIPDNIPEVLFPLEFTIESDRQGLENEPMGTIVVAPGPSLFSENGTDNRIQYRKSVTWTEYNAPLRMDVRDDNGTAISNGEDAPVTHRVRCRFRTIETVTDPTTVRVRIANDNFTTTNNTVTFIRTNAANSLTGPGLIWVAPTEP